MLKLRFPNNACILVKYLLRRTTSSTSYESKHLPCGTILLLPFYMLPDNQNQWKIWPNNWRTEDRRPQSKQIAYLFSGARALKGSLAQISRSYFLGISKVDKWRKYFESSKNTFRCFTPNRTSSDYGEMNPIPHRMKCRELILQRLSGTQRRLCMLCGNR